MGFGQLVIGPPGSGKTTYCDGICQFLNSIGRCELARVRTFSKLCTLEAAVVCLFGPVVAASMTDRTDMCGMGMKVCSGTKTISFLNGRETVIVNLDPGNDLLPYECAVDVMELISLEDVMNEFELGPNGGDAPSL